MGDHKKLKQKTKLSLSKYLENPQNLNSYSYTINNPLKHVDENGEWLDTIVDVGFIGYDLYKLGQAVFTGGDVRSELGNLGLDVGGAALPGVTGLGMMARVAKAGEKVNEARETIIKTNWGNYKTLSSHFKNHGADFDVKNANDYANQAQNFLKNSQSKELPTKIDSTGSIRIYDPKTNTLGSYNSDGTTKTFFKPNPSQHPYQTNLQYWKSQPGNLIQRGGKIWKP